MKKSRSINQFQEKVIKKGFGPQPPPKPRTEAEQNADTVRAVQRICGETLTIMSHPKGFWAGLQQRSEELSAPALERSRAARWKALARKLRFTLKLYKGKP